MPTTSVVIRPPESEFQTTEDGRLISLTKAAWEWCRYQVYDRAQGLCECCGREAPLHKTKKWRAGEADHRTSRKIRDDRLSNLRWLCWFCHFRRHTPAKVVPAKER